MCATSKSFLAARGEHGAARRASRRGDAQPHFEELCAGDRRRRICFEWVPKGTHKWAQFVTPRELARALARRRAPCHRRDRHRLRSVRREMVAKVRTWASITSWRRSGKMHPSSRERRETGRGWVRGEVIGREVEANPPAPHLTFPRKRGEGRQALRRNDQLARSGSLRRLRRLAATTSSQSPRLGLTEEPHRRIPGRIRRDRASSANREFSSAAQRPAGPARRPDAPPTCRRK